MQQWRNKANKYKLLHLRRNHPLQPHETCNKTWKTSLHALQTHIQGIHERNLHSPEGVLVRDSLEAWKTIRWTPKPKSRTERKCLAPEVPEEKWGNRRTHRRRDTLPSGTSSTISTLLRILFARNAIKASKRSASTRTSSPMYWRWGYWWTHHMDARSPPPSARTV